MVKEVKRLCFAGLDERTLLGEVVERFRHAMPFKAICFSALDPASGLIRNSVVEGLGGLKEARLFFEHIYLEIDNVYGYDETAEKWREPVRLLSEATGGQLERSLRYREQTGPLGLGYEMGGACVAGKELWGGIALIRERGDPDFDARELGLLRRVVPHLGAGLRASALLSQASPAETDAEDGPGVLVLDHRWRVIEHTPAAKRYLEDLGDLGPHWREDGNLPVAVWMVMGALHRSLHPQADRDTASVPCLSVKARSGRWLTLQGSLTEAEPGSPSQRMIVIEPTGPRRIAWLKSAAYGLTPREREIVDLVLRGASRKQIAATLYISEYTVQDHLSNIFDKIGVRGREALLKRLFLDNLYPMIIPPEFRQTPL
ncbi:MAG TPA: LuxR C-terminal-related transcriptional regulator [Rubrobacter sp.]